MPEKSDSSGSRRPENRGRAESTEKDKEGGAVGECMCLQCGTAVPAGPNIPCEEMNCPQCGTHMVYQ